MRFKIKQFFKFKKDAGTAAFSLVELSISLVIISMIIGSALSVALTSDYNANLKQTNDKLDKIEEALVSFLALNKRLPCPANGASLIAAADFGIEGSSTTNGCGGANFNSGDVYSGVVPIRTLLLPDEFMFDGFGRRITYAVDYKFTKNNINNIDCDGATSTICFIDSDKNTATIIVNDAAGKVRTSNAVYILISHGENGHGAFIKNGSSKRVNAYPLGNKWRNNFAGELENSHFSNEGVDQTYNNIFAAKSYMRDESGNGEYFDDIVRYKDKDHLIKDAGKNIRNAIIYEPICRDVTFVMDNPINVCTGAYNESDCTNFANELYKRCL